MFSVREVFANFEGSLSARRAWIEIAAIVSVLLVNGVALRKESVDRNTLTVRNCSGPDLSLSARRAWIEIVRGAITAYPVFVALRKESVDRNLTSRHLVDLGQSRSPQGERG